MFRSRAGIGTLLSPPQPLKSFGLPSTPQTLFRIPFKGLLDGPHVSQFFLLPVPYGSMPMEQRYVAPVPGQSFGVSVADWLAMHNGAKPSAQTQYEMSPRYLATPRDLAEFVHRGYPFQAYLCAALILSNFGLDALSETNPYKWSKSQAGFVTFGAPHVIDCMARASNAALKAAWHQKWLVHRRGFRCTRSERTPRSPGRLPRLV